MELLPEIVTTLECMTSSVNYQIDLCRCGEMLPQRFVVRAQCDSYPNQITGSWTV